MFIKTKHKLPKPEEQGMQLTLYYFKKRMITYSLSNSFYFVGDLWAFSLGLLTGECCHWNQFKSTYAGYKFFNAVILLD